MGAVDREVPGEEIGWELKGSMLRGSRIGFPENGWKWFSYYMQCKVKGTQFLFIKRQYATLFDSMKQREFPLLELIIN